MNRTQTTQTMYHGNFVLDESGVWLAQIEEIPQVHTFGRTLGKARQYLADALALWLDVPTELLKDRIEYRPAALPPALLNAVHEAKAAREIAEGATATASDLMTTAARALTEEAKLSLRDASELLGISHQRVQQLVVHGNGSLAVTGSGRLGIAQDVARSLKEFLPGGEKEELGVIAAGVALGLAIAWTQTHD
ncbi:MAG: type II toxin-antitoxin system HicB family antitoxin [Acidimicrobiales bacterium]|jgi:predicted RNase H-like HicB family nuclease